MHPTELRHAAQAMLAAVDRERPGVFPMVPVVDGDVLPEAPIAAMAAGRARRVPLIIGTNRDEATLFARYLQVLPTTPKRLEAFVGHSDPDAFERILGAYPGYPDPRVVVRIGGDAIFWRPTVDVVEHSRYAPVYNYRYDYAPGILHRSGFGAAHASELIAVFGLVDTPYGRAFTAGGGRRGLRAVTEEINRNWLSFAHSGFPLPSWPRYTAESRGRCCSTGPAGSSTISRATAAWPRVEQLQWPLHAAQRRRARALVSDLEVTTSAGVVRDRRADRADVAAELPMPHHRSGCCGCARRSRSSRGPACGRPPNSAHHPRRSRLVHSDEELLTLNVVAPAGNSTPRTVLVYFHGGAYIAGSSRLYRGENLVRRGDVVFVAANYRLEDLGYLDFASSPRHSDSSTSTAGCAIRSRCCSGSATTSPRSAATRTAS